ncbi:hypothetical protein C8J57DRAFT_1661704 [Mycena rebaudengoi]|nr:hypothetical protein C8J57DRAFT_1661704 [Mycena rebaudengoi]
MSSMNETSLSFFSSILPNNNANTIIGAAIITTVTVLIIHHISPTRLTNLLVALMHETDTIYIGAMEAGLVPADIDTAEALSKLQIEVSELHEETLKNSDVQDLKTRIEISKEEQLRNLNSVGTGTAAAWTMSARRRHVHLPGSRCHCRCN